eukprot:6476216-Amphidinium_carterae.1
MATAAASSESVAEQTDDGLQRSQGPLQGMDGEEQEEGQGDHEVSPVARPQAETEERVNTQDGAVPVHRNGQWSESAGEPNHYDWRWSSRQNDAYTQWGRESSSSRWRSQGSWQGSWTPSRQSSENTWQGEWRDTQSQPVEQSYMMTRGANSNTGLSAAAYQEVVVRRDNEPPPGFDGTPDLYVRWRRMLDLWLRTTDIKAEKRGRKLLGVLTGAALNAALTVSDEDLTSGEGVQAILQVLDLMFSPYKEARMQQAFVKAVYEGCKAKSESFMTYVARKSTELLDLDREGCVLPSMARGLVLVQQAKLGDRHADDLRTWTENRFELHHVTKALIKMDTDGKRSTSNYTSLFEEEEEEGMDAFWEEGSNATLSEGEAEVLVQYAEARRMLQQKKLNRGYFRGEGKGEGKGDGKGKGKQAKGYKTSLENLIARTRCALCKEKGHWKRECPKKGQSTLWVQEGREPWLQHAAHSEEPFFVGYTCGVQMECGDVEESIGHTWYGFVGLVTADDSAVVDTGAENGVIGEQAMKRLEQSLMGKGLRVQDLKGKASNTNGIGGQAQVIRRCLIPIGLGGQNGYLKTTVIRGEVPLLLPIRLMEMLGAVISLPEHTIYWQAVKKRSTMVQLPSGHVTVNIAEYGERGWRAPVMSEPLGQQTRAEPDTCGGNYSVIDHDQYYQGGEGNSRGHLSVGVLTNASRFSERHACGPTLRSVGIHQSVGEDASKSLDVQCLLPQAWTMADAPCG